MQSTSTKSKVPQYSSKLFDTEGKSPRVESAVKIAQENQG